MLIDDIKKANLQALKEKNTNARSAYSAIVTRYQNLLTSGQNKEVGDVDVIRLIQKYVKELDEEKEGYVKAGRSESAEAIELQKAALTPFLPQMLSEEEIKTIIASLEDKSIPAVMKHFKANYDGKCDMGLVSKLARQA